MTCLRTSEIDLPAFLDEPRRPEFAEFREHYPRCRDCAAEVRAWTELQAALRARGAGAAHPAPEQLARYEGAPGGLAPAERRALEAHLATCPACRDELRALRGFAPAARSGPTPARAAAPARRREWLAALRRLLWHPALAYALLAAFVAPTLYRQVVGHPPAVERAAKPTELAKAEEARRVEVEATPAAAGVREIPAEAERASEPAAARIADAARALAPEPESLMEVHAAAPVPEPKASAGLGRAAPAAERVRAPPPPAADRELARTLRASPSSAAEEVVLAREVAVEEVAEERLGEQALAAEAPAAPAPALALALRAGEIPRVDAASARAGLRLSLSAPGPGELEIRVVAPGGGRELRERRASEADAATIEVPPEWLAPGRYGVSVRRLGAGLVTDEAGFAFDVEDAP